MSNFFGFQGGTTNSESKKEEASRGLKGKFSSAFGQLMKEMKDLSVNEATLSGSELYGRGLQYMEKGNYEKAHQLFVAGACKLEPICMLQLHEMYAEGKGVEKDDTQAWFWARMSGDYGDGTGDYLTGLHYINGVGVEKNLEKAWKYMERSVRRGCNDAVSYYEELSKNHIKIVYSTPEEARSFNRDSLLAREQGPEKYFEFCMKVASFEDDNDGKNWLGLCYREGNGTEADDIAAVIWFKKAIEYGNPFGLWNLAHMYACGRGVLVDYQEALRLAEASAEKGHSLAGKYVQKVQSILDMSGEELSRKAAEAVYVGNGFNNIDYYLQNHYYTLAAQKGSARNCSTVAYQYRNQEGVKRDKNEYLFYLGKSFLLYKSREADNMDSIGNIYYTGSYLYSVGEGVVQNSAIADKYFKMAQKYNEKLRGFATITDYINHFRSNNVSQKNAYDLAQEFEREGDVEKAISYYEMCAKKNNVKAYVDLIRIYLEGYAVPRDSHKALEVAKMCEKAITSSTNAKLDNLCYHASVCGWVLRAYNHEEVEFYDQLSGEMALDLCKKVYRRGDVHFARFCFIAARFKGAMDAERVWEELEQETLARVRAEEKAEKKTEQEELDRKMRTSEYQNAQCEPEKKAIEFDGPFDTEVEEIRNLVNEKRFAEIADKGCEYLDNENENYNERLGILCFKIAMLQGDISALCAIGISFAAGTGLPRDLSLAEKILNRVIELDSDQIEKDEVTEILDQVQQEMEDGATREEMEQLAQEYREIADDLEKAYYLEEAWILYEYYRMSSFEQSLRGYLPKYKLKDKYFSQRVDWEQVLAMPWEKYCQTQETSEGIEVNSLSTSVLDQEEMPDNLEKYFEGMIGMESVKEQLDKIYQSVKMQLLREQILRSRNEEVQQSGKGYNFILLGNPGTGKTTVARIIAQVLYDIKVRTSDSFIEIERSGVVSDHVGGTEKRMKEILSKVEGGTLFIDEAYALYKEDSDTDFGQEAIDVLMKDMEDHRNLYSVIMAGYKEPMMNMIKNANSGFSSRFSYIIELPDYSDEALIEIAHKHVEKQKFVLEEGVDAAIKKCIAHDKLDHTFGNARYIRELVHRAIENQSQRLTQQGEYEDNDLFLLKAQDFWQDDLEEEGVDKYLAELNGLIGLKAVKEEVNSLINLITVQKEMERRGLESTMDFGTLHMAFKGNPGTGKTTVARIIGKLYGSLGVLKRGDIFVECTRADLVGKFQGHTAANVKKVVESALGGVLFIDEAYSLVQGEGDSFGREAVDTLVAEMENHRQNLVVIFAGYTKDLDEFFKNNQGLKSRVPKDLFFEDYDLHELYDIAVSMIKAKKMILTPAAEEAIRGSLVKRSLIDNFGNARGVRNIVDAICRKQNVRIAQLLKNNTNGVSDDVLITIEAEDIE